MLITVGRTLGGLIHPGTIEDLDAELIKVVEDFDRALNVEALRLAQKSGQQYSLS